MDFGSSGVFVLMVLAGIFVWVIDRQGKPLSTALALSGSKVLDGEVWRIVTWPFSGLGFSLWTLLTMYLIWYFGGELEALIGRKSMAWLLLAEVVAFALLDVVLTLVFPGAWFVLAGPSLIANTILLLYIAEYPRRPFFFGIPAWVVAAVFVGVSILLLIGNQEWIPLVNYLLTIVVGALVARQFGLLNDYPFIPRLFGRPRRPKLSSVPRPAPVRHPEHPSAGAPRVPVTDLHAYEAQFQPGAFSGPVGSPEHRMDELLDKVASQGLSSLTPAERSELEALSKRPR